jgi:hypothetical protein
VKKRAGVWHCLERLTNESNPRLVVIIEKKDAQHLLKMRDALKALATGNVGKAKIAAAKRLLAQK